MNVLFSDLFAQGAAAGTKNPSFIEVFLLPMAIIFSIFYFLIIRPQNKRAKSQQSFIQNLKKGDEVLTSSGIFGKVTGITDSVVTVEISEGVKIKMLKSNIASPSVPAPQVATK